MAMVVHTQVDMGPVLCGVILRWEGSQGREQGAPCARGAVGGHVKESNRLKSKLTSSPTADRGGDLHFPLPRATGVPDSPARCSISREPESCPGQY